MSQQLQNYPLTEEEKETQSILETFVIEIQEQEKADNPQMVVNKIWKWVKPEQYKSIEMICNLIRNSSAKIEQGEEESEVDGIVNELVDNWQEREDSQHLQDIRAAIINHKYNLSLLILYQKVITIIGEAIKFDNNQIQKHLLELGLVKKEKNNLVVTNLFYEQAFNEGFVLDAISDIIKRLIADIWQYGVNLEHKKNKVFNIIQEHLPQLALKTNNLNAIIKEILIWSNPEPCLTEGLLKLASDNQSKTFIPEKEEKKWIKGLVQLNWFDKNNWKSQPIAEHLFNIQSTLTNNQNCNSFWLLLTYSYILRGEAIPFNSEKEEEELLNLNLIFKNVNNKLNVANNIYKNIFSKQWVSNELKNSQNPHRYNLLAWIDSDTFKNDVVILSNKFPNNIKNIIQEIISWVHNSSELASKIVRFTETGIILNESDKQDWNIQQKYFQQNIMYSPSLGNYLSKEDIKILIKNFLNTDEYQGKKGISQTNQNLQKLIGKFKNSLPIVKEIIFETQAELEATSYIVEQILKDDSIIKSEEDVNKIANVAKDFDNQKTTKKRELYMGQNQGLKIHPEDLNLDDLLDYIIEKTRDIEAILLVSISDQDVQYYNSQLELTSPELYQKLKDTEGRLEGLQNFEYIENLPSIINDFAEEIGCSRFSSVLFSLNNPSRTLIFLFVDIKGANYAVCYIGKEGVSKSKLFRKFEKTIKYIKPALERDDDL